MQRVYFRDLGLIDYKEAWDYQEKLFQRLIDRKLKNRDRPVIEQQKQEHFLIFCEHSHVFTLGRSGKEENLLTGIEELERINATFFRNNRGGDITYHGPGQIVGYPILDLDLFFTDIHKYLRLLEEAVILTLSEFGIKGDRFPGLTGVWLDPFDPLKARKICALGIRCSRWVTMHGFAFNVNTQLDYFNHIIPCGITEKSVTSMEKELGAKQDISLVKKVLREKIAMLFEMDLVQD
jgi:lipoyl(octanoyl) transferase